MQLTAQQVFDVTLLVSQIIRERRPMPQKGQYRLARLHAKLLPEFNAISSTRDKMIMAYDTHVKIPDGNGGEIDGQDFAVPADKLAEFTAAWDEIAKEPVEIDVQPIPLACLDRGDSSDGAITAQELITLGDLITDG